MQKMIADIYDLRSDISALCIIHYIFRRVCPEKRCIETDSMVELRDDDDGDEYSSFRFLLVSP